MNRTCDICQPASRKYAVYFDHEQDISRLNTYSQMDEWKLMEGRIFSMSESAFYDLMDYVEAHLAKKSVLAVQLDTDEGVPTIESMKPITTFKDGREASWVDSLIQEKRLATHYQPIVELKDGGEVQILGHELLSRGLDEAGQIIPPFELFAAARKRNRLFALDRACRMACIQNASFIQDKMLFINFIPTAIYAPEHCLATTFQLIRKFGLKPENIVFEVVETDRVENMDHLKSILRYYKERGFNYALDDVGTGYNRINILEELEPDIVKLAFEFTNGVSIDHSKQQVAKEVLAVTKNIGARGLAEGVETKNDFYYLAELGYELFQGYYFSKPLERPVSSLVLN